MKNIKLLEEYNKDHSLFLYPNQNTDEASAEAMQYDLFLNAIKHITSEVPVMIELGVSHFPTYSRMFNTIFDNTCINICTEVRTSRLIEAKQKFPNGIFYHTYSGVPAHIQEPLPDDHQEWNSTAGISNIPFKTLLNENNIEYVDMLHMDIQGSEVSLLEELERDNLHKKINYFCISIHEGCFDKCCSILESWGVTYIFSSATQGGWNDGLIVCKNNK